MRKVIGFDIVLVRFLRECFNLIFDFLVFIFNRLIEISIFFDEWKSIRIIFFYKKCGNRSDFLKYWLILIIFMVVKVLKWIVYD